MKCPAGGLIGTMSAFSVRTHSLGAAYTHQLYFTSMCFAKRPGFTDTMCSYELSFLRIISW